MIDLFMPFRSIFKLNNVSTDNNVFRMHYMLTVTILLVFTLLVSTKQFFGEPMHCVSESDKDHDKEAMNSYCWIYGTYTLKSRLVGKIGKDMAYVGVGPDKSLDAEQIKHTYYQWVCFVFLAQAAMFYTPHYLWKIWEGGRLKALASELANPLISKDWSDGKRSELVTYLTYTNLYTHNMYALRYAFCELLNLVNVVGQIFLLDQFLGGAFRDYGAAVTAFTHVPKVPKDFLDFDAVNPMDKYFPKLTKCWFRSYGPSGTLQLKDRLCILPLNIVNEKIFVFLWFWLVFLAFLSTLAVLYRILIISMPPLRTLMIMGQLRFVKRRIISKIVYRISFGDWFILHLLGKNMNPLLYKELIIEVSKELEKRPNNMI
ncbi:innexin inx2 [Bicyclus anynana]|uniref:Innexin n=1 Tax=Bicyclus anynana TaxID=110368 RepID=A0A6J1MWH1_BICAN|nr:innexin inx2 [Bicyclus anynana]